MDLKVIDDDLDLPLLLGGIRLIEKPEHITEQGVRLARPEAVGQRAGGQIEGTSQVVFLVLARCHDGQLGAARPPRTAPVGQQVHIQLIRKHHGLTPRQLFVDEADVRQAVDPLRVVALATSFARFQTQPMSWSQRRIVSAETARPRVVCSVRASVAQLQRVRHQPEARGGIWSRASSDRRRGGSSTAVRTVGTSRP
jgi:hypothetical protein